MSNAFMGQRQQASPMGFGGYSGGYDPFGGGYGGGMGGYNPFGGGYGTQFGGYDMGGGGGFGGYGGGMRAPAYEPTINDAFSRYFSQQYYGGPAFDPFAATSFFGGGYGGGFGFGGGGRRGGGMGGRMRRRRQMFEDLFQPENTPLPQPITARDDLARIQPMPIGGGAYQPGGGGQRVEMGAAQPITGGSLFSSLTSTQPTTPYSTVNPYANETDAQRNERIGLMTGRVFSSGGIGAPRGTGGITANMSGFGPYTPQPYMGEVDSIMPVQVQDTPVYAPTGPSYFDDRFLSRGGMYR